MDTWDALFEQAKWRCEGSYKAQPGIDGGLDVQMRFSRAGNTFPKVPFLLQWPEEMGLSGLVLTPGFATGKVTVGGGTLDGLEVFAEKVTSTWLPGAELGIRVKMADYPYVHWGARYLKFSGAPNQGTVQVVGAFDVALPSGGGLIAGLPVGIENLRPKPEAPAQLGMPEPDDEFSRGIIRLGAVSPTSGHVLPTPHHNLVLSDDVLQTEAVAVVAPCDGIIHRIVHRLVLAPQNGQPAGPLWIAYHDFAIHIASGPRYDVVIGHLHGLSPESFRPEDMESMAYSFGMQDIQVTPEGFTHGVVPGVPALRLAGSYALDGTKTVFSAEFDAWRPVTAGQPLGTAGGYASYALEGVPEHSLSFGAMDYRAPRNQLASPATYELVDERMLFAKSPLDRLAGKQLQQEVAGALWHKEGVPGDVPFGHVSFDRPQSISGNWFALGAAGAERGLAVNQLALVYDVWDPSRPLVSVGDETLRLKSSGVEVPGGDGVYRVSAWAEGGSIEGLWNAPLDKLESEPMLVEVRPGRGPMEPGEGGTPGPATLVLGTQKGESGWQLVVVMVPQPIEALPHGCRVGKIRYCATSRATRVYVR
jgi:hypothetical protein